MTNWGIPADWLDPHAYGDTKRWSLSRWRWEFTRRRDDCRADFLAHKDETVRFCEEALPADEKRGRLRRPDEPGFTARVSDCYKKYGLSALPNPAIGDQPFYVIIFEKSGPRLVLWTTGVNNHFQGTEAVILFDLTAPIDVQLKGAKQLLESKQKKQIGHLVQPSRRHPTKWLTYLRILDAKESGASLSQIAKSGVLGPARRADPQSARDVLKQAKALCFKWPS
jgi:hypothetical protein